MSFTYLAKAYIGDSVEERVWKHDLILSEEDVALLKELHSGDYWTKNGKTYVYLYKHPNSDKKEYVFYIKISGLNGFV